MHSDKTEEEICQFIIGCINNACDEEQQDLLIKDFKKNLPMEEILRVNKEYKK